MPSPESLCLKCADLLLCLAEPQQVSVPGRPQTDWCVCCEQVEALAASAVLHLQAALLAAIAGAISLLIGVCSVAPPTAKGKRKAT